MIQPTTKKAKLKKCCNDEDNLKYIRAHSCWPFEIWACDKCEREYDVELIRDFKNKECR